MLEISLAMRDWVRSRRRVAFSFTPKYLNDQFTANGLQPQDQGKLFELDIDGKTGDFADAPTENSPKVELIVGEPSDNLDRAARRQDQVVQEANKIIRDLNQINTRDDADDGVVSLVTQRINAQNKVIETALARKALYRNLQQQYDANPQLYRQVMNDLNT